MFIFHYVTNAQPISVMDGPFGVLIDSSHLMRKLFPKTSHFVDGKGDFQLTCSRLCAYLSTEKPDHYIVESLTCASQQDAQCAMMPSEKVAYKVISEVIFTLFSKYSQWHSEGRAGQWPRASQEGAPRAHKKKFIGCLTPHSP
jgi:hypothetical protein